jgi:hypothetical protein
MGAWVSLVFNRDSDVDADDEAPPQTPVTRRQEEVSLADSCLLVHQGGVTLMMYLTADPRAHVTALGESIGDGNWTESAQTLLRTIWNGTASRWFCAAVESGEGENNQEEKQAGNAFDVQERVPWDNEWSITECALLIRSICLCFSACYLDCFRH